MNKDLIIGKQKLNQLIDYVNTFDIDEFVLYEKFNDTFAYLGAYYDIGKDNHKLSDEQKTYLKCCSVLNNLFKHKKELNGSYDELQIKKYGTDLSNCILGAPFGDVVFFTHSDYLDGLKDKQNSIYYKKYIENQRLDIFLNKLKKIVGGINE